MYYDYPVTRKFSTPIHTPMGGCILKYEQNTIKDTMIMMNNYSVKWYLEQRLEWFLIDSLEVLLEKESKQKYIAFLMDNPTLVFDRVWNNLNRNHETIYKNVRIRDEDSSDDKMLLSSTMMYVCKEYGISWPKDLLDWYTLEQYERMVEWIRFSNYRLNPKTTIYNRQAMVDKYNEREENRKLMDYARKWPTKEFLDEYFAKNGSTNRGTGSTNWSNGKNK